MLGQVAKGTGGATEANWMKLPDFEANCDVEAMGDGGCWRFISTTSETWWPALI